MAVPPVECPHCGYEIATYSEAVEALENGARCLRCGGGVALPQLEEAVDSWSDERTLEEGARRARMEGDDDGEDDLFEGVPDFGDEGEDDPVF